VGIKAPSGEWDEVRPHVSAALAAGLADNRSGKPKLV
jgi:hypothetical protein